MNVMGGQKESLALNEIRGLVQAGRPLIYLLSHEEGRVAELLNEAANTLFPNPVPLFTWSVTEGMRGPQGLVESGDGGPRAALDFVAAYEGAALFLLKDFHEPIRQSATVRRRLRDLYASCLDSGKFIFLASAVREIPDEMSRDVALLELRTPDLPEIVDFIEREARVLQNTGVVVDPDPITRRQLARALVGLTLDESRHALRRAAAAGKHVDGGSIPHLLEEKHLIVKKTGVIEYVPTAVGLDDLGGVSYLKKWLLERRKLFAMRDEISADIVPKGILIMGISGCGKSLAVKAIASCFEIPLYRVDMVEVFSGRHGPAETAFTDACHTLEAMAPAVMWVDEIEMGISARIDDAAGMLGRIFGFFLTWMQEKARGLFVAATANRIDLLPAEMIRKGRFDEVFFVDLPTEDERLDIFQIHLRRRGVDPEKMDLDRLRQFTRGWTGAEVEQCVVSALTLARLEDRDLHADDLLNTTAKIVPLSKTMKEQVEHIRGWALDRAVRAAPRAGERG
jgi:ATP-dependent 26S proteasome regulatory subunit